MCAQANVEDGINSYTYFNSFHAPKKAYVLMLALDMAHIASFRWCDRLDSSKPMLEHAIRITRARKDIANASFACGTAERLNLAM